MKQQKFRAYADRLALLLILPLLCGGCAPRPNDEQIKTAIRASLAAEAEAPALDLSEMEVPVRTAGKANAVVWTADKTLQRNYVIAYDSSERAFTVTDFSTCVLGDDGTYAPLPPAALTAYADRFSFSAQPGERLAVVYAGTDTDGFSAREKFDERYFADLSAEETALFSQCDLGGSVLVVLVPKYAGTVISVTETATFGDALISGDEAGRFDDGMPVYLRCDWNGAYDISVYFEGEGGFFRVDENMLDACKNAQKGYIY